MSKQSSRVSKLSKQSHIALNGAVAAAGFVASSAVQAEVIVISLDETARDGGFFFDLNKDGIDDFSVFSKERTETSSGSAAITGVFRKDSVGSKIDSLKIAQSPTVLIDPTLMGSTRETYVARLEVGDSVSAKSGMFAKSGLFYRDGVNLDDDEIDRARTSLDTIEEDDQFGAFQSVDDTGYIGLSLTFSEAELMDERAIELSVLEDTPVFSELSEFDSVTYYGWAEVVRGSLTVLRIGFQNIPFDPALITGRSVPVSEPATLGLLALGAAGLAGLRRRKKQRLLPKGF